jgi:hypothetical protein
LTPSIVYFFYKAHASAFPGARFSRTVRQFYFSFTFYAHFATAASQRPRQGEIAGLSPRRQQGFLG